MPVAQKLFLIGCAGGLGTLARYGLAGVVQRAAGLGFPWGTFTVNMIGSFAFGLVWSLIQHRLGWGGEARAIVLTGFMGAFTTFSTFMFETGELLRDSEWFAAAGNLVGQNIIGLIFVFAGLALGRLI